VPRAEPCEQGTSPRGIADDGPGGTYRLAGTEGNAIGWKGTGRWGQNIDFPRGRCVQTWLDTVAKP
jgi:hypothetical protein